MIISFIGPDGSGKSTAIKYSEEYLKKNNISYKILYPFNYFLLRLLINFANKSNFTGGMKKKRNTKNKNIIIKIFWPLLALIDAWIWFFYVKLCNKKIQIILCDRYFHDLHTAFDEFNLAFLSINKWYIKLVPKPNKLILLSGMPHILKSRESDDSHEIDFFERQVKRYNDLYLKDSRVTALNINFSREDIENIFNEASLR
jgi:thymidylate kinase